MNTVIVLTCLAICLFHQVTCQVAGGSCPADTTFTQQFRDPTDCSKYYKCTNGVFVDYKCPVGLVFSPDTTACDWPNKVTTGCTATTTALDPSAQPLQFPADICPIQPCSKTKDYILPNYNKPGLGEFYYCKGGELYEQTCGVSPGTQGYPYFNVLRTSCEKGKSYDSLYEI